jgi:hypothetical protein
VSLPAADDLFRPTAVPDPAEREGDSGDDGDASSDVAGDRAPSGRVRHDEKMTVYVTADELLDVEHTRLMLRRNHGLAVDRGRLVRQAIAIALADFELNGDESVLVQRLTQA